MTRHALTALLVLALCLANPQLLHARTKPLAGEVSAHLRSAASTVGPWDKLCHACTQAVEQVEVVLSDPSLANDSIAIIEETVCAKLPDAEKQQCSDAVEQYVPVVLAALASEVTVENLCVEKAHLCPPDSGAAVDVQGPEDCYACRLVVKLLKKHLKNPKTQANIKKFLEDKCTKISNATYAAECTDALEKFLPVVFANLDIILDDKKLCKDASLCPVAKVHSGIATA